MTVLLTFYIAKLLNPIPAIAGMVMGYKYSCPVLIAAIVAVAVLDTLFYLAVARFPMPLGQTFIFELAAAGTWFLVGIGIRRWRRCEQ